MTKYQELDRLIDSASQVCEIPYEDIVYGARGKRCLSDARHIICHIAARVAHIPVSLLILGQVTGRADHSSAEHSLYAATNLLFADHDFRKKYKAVQTRFNELVGDERYDATTIEEEFFYSVNATA